MKSFETTRRSRTSSTVSNRSPTVDSAMFSVPSHSIAYVTSTIGSHA